MPVPFSEIPAHILPPLFYAEAEPSQAPFNQSLKIVLIGMQNSLSGAQKGTAAPNVPYILSDNSAQELFGRGSMLHAMYHFAHSNAPFNQLWGVALEESEDSGNGTMTIIADSAEPIRNEELHFLIAGFPVGIITRVGDTRATVANKLVKAIRAQTMAPVAAAIDPGNANKVILTCRWGGAQTCKQIRITTSLPGKTYAAARRLLIFSGWGSDALGGGIYGSALAALSDEKFDIFCCGFGMSTQIMDVLQDEFDGTAGRWSPYRQQYGHAILGYNASFSTLFNTVEPRNDPHLTFVGTDITAPQPPWHWASAVAARMAQHWAAPPELSRPLQTLELRGIIPPPREVARFDIMERQALLEAGVTTYITDADSTVRIDRVRTTYKRNVWGDNDFSWSDAITLFQISFFIRSMRAVIRGTFPRAALTTEETGIPGFASPGLVHDVIVHHYRELEILGLVENTALFAEALIVERNLLDANRLDVLARPDVVNQLRIVAMLVQSYLELTATPANSLV